MAVKEFNLDPLRQVLSLMGAPHLEIPVISVAGTNGKGSVSATLLSIFSEAGMKTGVYTSPHVFDFKERININGINISLTTFKRIFKDIRAAERTAGTELSKFETVTAAAVKYFSDKKCDLCIMEAGLGGRLDATNVCENRLVTVITPVSLEHTEYLGDTIEEIAAEKTGLIREGTKVVDFSGAGIVREKALDMGCAVSSLGREYRVEDIRPSGFGNYSYNLVSGQTSIGGVETGLKGSHQCFNSAAAAVAAGYAGISNTEIIKYGIKNTVLKGRLDIYDIEDGKKFIVDAAHNPSGMEIVRQFADEWKPADADLYLIMGVYRDKDYRKMIEAVLDIAAGIIAFTPASDRALDARELCEAAGDKCICEKNFAGAYSRALNISRPGSWIMACGSFATVRPALKYNRFIEI